MHEQFPHHRDQHDTIRFAASVTGLDSEAGWGANLLTTDVPRSSPLPLAAPVGG